MHYFHAPVGPVWNDKKRIGRRYTELVFLYPIGYAGHVTHSGTSGHESLTHYFSCSGETGTDATITAPRHVTPKCVFASGGIFGSRSAFWCARVAKCRGTIFHARVGAVHIAEKSHWTTLRRTSVFASSGICGSYSAFWCIRGAKIRRVVFMLGWDQYRTHKKCARTRYAGHVFLHPTGSVAHIVHSDACGARNIDALFFMLGWDWLGFDKKRVRTHYIKLVFLYLVGSMGNVVHSGASGP
jgi:hypothetical protein